MHFREGRVLDENASFGYHRSGKRWSKDELRSLRIQASKARSVYEVKIEGRSPWSVQLKLISLKIHPNPHWTPKEDQFLRNQVLFGRTLEEIKIPGRSLTSIKYRLRRLGISFMTEAEINRAKLKKIKVRKRKSPKQWTSEEIAEVTSQLEAGIPPGRSKSLLDQEGQYLI